MKTLRYLALFIVAAGVQTAFADIAFNNFGPGDTFDIGTGYTASGPSSVAGRWESACQFTSATSGILDSVTIAVSHVLGANSVHVTMYDDAGDTVGAWFTDWSFGGLSPFGTSFTPITLINAFPSITLTAGTKYWVAVRPGGDDTWAVWNWNDQGQSGLRGYSTDGGATYSYGTARGGAMRVETRPVPEPATLATLGLGVAALLRRRRK